MHIPVIFRWVDDMYPGDQTCLSGEINIEVEHDMTSYLGVSHCLILVEFTGKGGRCHRFPNVFAQEIGPHLPVNVKVFLVGFG